MRNFLRGLGKVLMCIAAFGFLVTLICSFPMARDLGLSLLENLLIILSMLLMYLGLFFIGYLINKAGCKEPKQKKSSPVTQVVMKAQRQKPPTPVIQATAPVPSVQPQPAEGTDALPGALPLPETFRMVLYRDASARDEASLRDGEAVPELMELAVREGTPLVLVKSVSLGELFSGSMYREEQKETEIPKAMRGSLSVDSFFSWVEKTVPGLKKKNWRDAADRDVADRFCRLVRRLAAMPVRRWVYYTEPPFTDLKYLGPDGLKDMSGIAFWLLRKKGANPGRTLEEAETIAKDGKTVLLTEKQELFAEAVKEKQSSLADSGLMVCILKEQDLLLDLVSRKQYRFYGEEWAGSADDAATYGLWGLKEEEKTD